MRLFLIILLIIYHSFAPFSGNWEAIGTKADIPTYRWIGNFSYSFFLESFVFISGLLLGSRSIKKPLGNEGYGFILGKIKRLILPSVLFSITYFLCFYQWNGVSDFAYTILNGSGHLWFLPMLFWLFVGLWILTKLNLSPQWTFFIAIASVCLSNSSLSLRLGNSMYYFLFFFFGFLIEHGALKKLVKPTTSLITFYSLTFIVVFLFCKITNINGGFLTNLIMKLLHCIYGLSGTLACYLIIIKTVPTNMVLPKWAMTLSGYSFGIYIMQQFILKWLYYYTDLPMVVDYVLLPWIGIAIALIGSIFITHILYKLHIGKHLL